MITEAHFSVHVDGGNKGDEEMLGKYGVGEKCKRTDGWGFYQNVGNSCCENALQKEGGT